MSYAIGAPVLWPIPPDWSQPVRESLAWLTDYMQARDGTRQKRQMRIAPRRAFVFQATADADDRRILDALRFDQGVRQWALPIWPDVQLLAAPLAAGATSIPCDTVGRDFIDGGQAVLWSARNVWELVAVQTVAANALTLTAPTVGAWAAGTRLYPVRTARLQGTPGETHFNDDLSRTQVQLLIDEPCDWASTAPAATYRGAPVLEWRFDESDDPTSSYERMVQTVDEQTGPISYFDLPALPFRVQSHRWTLFGRSERTAFRSLLYWLRGRMGTLWVPSYQADLQLASAVGASDAFLTVMWCGYTVFGRTQANRRDIRIELRDGTVFYRRITGSTEAGATEQITIDSALGMAVSAAAVRVISFMTLAELASDGIDLDHVHDVDGIAQCTTGWRGVKNDL
ncbi:MAG TPA: hypothetical protein VF216_04705 [Mizugakiibacter sp.]